MQLIITDSWLAKSRAIRVTSTQLSMLCILGFFLVALAAYGGYQIYSHAQKTENWVKALAIMPSESFSETQKKDEFIRNNLDVLARQLGEIQVKVTELESLGERISGLAGVAPMTSAGHPGAGGVLLSDRPVRLEEIQTLLKNLDQFTSDKTKFLTLIESKLLEKKLQGLMIPTQFPLSNGDLGSKFGRRIDPFTGKWSFHSGMDFKADTGTPILAAAGGVVVIKAAQPEYGNVVEIDHGNGLVTRYAHASKILVKRGDLIKRGQAVALVGTSGRSTGPHLHFEVLVNNVAQDPQKFIETSQKYARLRPKVNESLLKK